MLCNRTQSGGDTYFCVDAVLGRCGLENNPDGDRFAVLTPFENESAPVDITVQVVDGECETIGAEHDFTYSLKHFVECMASKQQQRQHIQHSLRTSKDGSESEAGAQTISLLIKCTYSFYI